jgi:hypothetical protein
MTLQPPAGYYVSSLQPGHAGRADGWNEVLVRQHSQLRFVLASPSSAIRGMVKASGEPAGGAPVFLEGWDSSARSRIGELRMTRADMRGNYSFDGVAPGTYRILSTFDYTAPDVEAMAEGATEVTLDAHGARAQDLDLWGIR